MHKKSKKIDIVKFPRQTNRRRVGIGMAKVSVVCPSIRKNTAARLRRMRLNKPLKLTRSFNRKAKFVLWFPVFALLVLFFVIVRQNFFVNNTKQQTGMVLGEEEEKVNQSISVPYIDEEIVWPGKDLSFRYLDAQHKAPEILGDNYIYHRVYKNVDIWLKPFDFSLRQKMLFLHPLHPHSFSWKLSNLQGWQIEIKKGSLSFYKKDSPASSGLKLIYFVPTPYIEDNKGQRSVEAAKFKLDGELLKLILDEDWLKNASYPVSLDFTINRR